MRFNIYIFSVLMLMSFSMTVYGQDDCEYKVEGAIYDRQTGEPLAFATVQLKGTEKGVVADVDGEFYLNSICQEEFDLIFSHLGYKTVTHHHDIHHKLPKIYLAPEDFTLKSVIVEGKAEDVGLESTTIETIGSEDLASNRGASLGIITDRVSGVSLIQTGQNIVKPVIHGLHSNRILIVNQGVRHEYQSWGQEHAPEVDPALADNIKIIKGAASVKYGPDALGGVVILDGPKLELLSDLSGEMSLTGATNGKALIGQGRLEKGFHKVAIAVEGSYHLQGDLSTPDYLLTNTSKRESSLSFDSRYHIKNWDFNLYGSRFDQELGILTGSVAGNLDDLIRNINSDIPANTGPFDYDIQNPRQKVSHDLVKVNAKNFTGESSLFLQYAFQSNRRQEFDIRRGTNNTIPSINLELSSHILDMEWKHTEVMGWFGSIGGQAIYQDNNNIPGTNTIPFIPNYNNARVGVYIIESKQFDDILLEAGLRYDYLYNDVRGRQRDNSIYRNSLTFQNISATIGLTKVWSPNLSFSTNLGSAWRPPSITELYSFGRHQSIFEYGLLRYSFNENGEISAGNILTEEEKEVSNEVGYKWINSLEYKNESFQVQLSGYVNLIQDYIYSMPAGVTQTVRGTFPYFVFNQTDALFTGGDLDITYSHSTNLFSIFHGSYLYARDLGNEDYFVGIPPGKIGYRLEGNHKKLGLLKSIRWHIGASYTFEQYNAPRVVPIEEIQEAKEEDRELFTDNTAIFDFTAPPEGYLLLDVLAEASYKRFTGVFRINNLLNTSYRNYTDRLRYIADDVGRNLKLTVTYNF